MLGTRERDVYNYAGCLPRKHGRDGTLFLGRTFNIVLFRAARAEEEKWGKKGNTRVLLSRFRAPVQLLSSSQDRSAAVTEIRDPTQKRLGQETHPSRWARNGGILSIKSR